MLEDGVLANCFDNGSQFTAGVIDTFYILQTSSSEKDLYQPLPPTEKFFC